MLKFIALSSAQYPLGIPPGKKCLTVPGGPYAGRTAVLYAASPSSIKLVAADAPYTAVTSPIDVAVDAADTPFDAFMSASGHIYVAYIVAGTYDLAFVKLSFSGGVWTAGTKVSVFTADECSQPNMCCLTTGQLWIAYTRLNGGLYYVSVKVSSDDGVNWGSVSDPGDTLTSGATSACASMVEQSLCQYVFYTEGGAKLAYRTKANGAILWDSEIILASGGGFNEWFSVAAGKDGRIGVAYVNASGLRFREYSGSTWTAEAVVEDGALSAPAVAYRGGDAFVLYTRDSSDGRHLLLAKRKEAAGFSTAVAVDSRKTDLKKLLVYNAAVGSYQDKTVEAASESAGDVLHSASSALLDAVGDAVYFGQDEPFNAVYVRLSAIGAGGEVVWKYWDGQGWKATTPYSGTWSFSSSEQDILLWPDYHSIPADWQKRDLSGHSCYWLAASVTAAFSTPPVGSRLTAITGVTAFSLQGEI
ncbi:MAG: exo-alpha-sialidase [candidate division Zixibacteria bacterium]|nr:exo-alpha-sialidase [candidate division Zixibacteria bacterium]